MSSSAAWKVHIDGAARGNPGPAAFAFIIQREGVPALEEKATLGTMTNNLAEYTALVRALERARELGAERLIVHSDSELLVKQMNGEYRVKNPDLRVLYDRARELRDEFKQVVIRHVPRDQNSGADRLCNEALDDATTDHRLSERTSDLRSPNRSGGLRPVLSHADHHDRMIREKAIDHLRSAAANWAKGNADSPPPEAVWDQLWRLLEDAGLVPSPDE
jgi:ribonuclease HI